MVVNHIYIIDKLVGLIASLNCKTGHLQKIEFGGKTDFLPNLTKIRQEPKLFSFIIIRTVHLKTRNKMQGHMKEAVYLSCFSFGRLSNLFDATILCNNSSGFTTIQKLIFIKFKATLRFQVQQTCKDISLFTLNFILQKKALRKKSTAKLFEKCPQSVCL